jgi:hypothetical protein
MRADVVLVGGTGRSGSTVVGHLLDHHRDFTLSRPMEVRFIAGNDGFADALHIAQRKPGSAKALAAATLATDRLLHRWYMRAPDVGLHTSVSQQQIKQWADLYLETFPTDPQRATVELTNAILGAIAETLDAQRLVDTTPANSRKADRLEAILPQAKVITVLRDGRDVAASFTQQTFGPDDVFVALEQWEQRMRKCHRAALAAAPNRVLFIELRDLVERRRSQTLSEILTFLGVEDDPQMQAWFEEHMNPAHAHLGRWRADFDAEICRRIDAQYADIVERLTAEGVRIPSE